MKIPSENNIFTNPEGWAGKVVGTSLRYRFMQILTVFTGICLIVFFALGRRRGYSGISPVAVFISTFAIAFPLMYLKALRALFMKMQGSKGNQQGGAPDAQKPAPR